MDTPVAVWLNQVARQRPYVRTGVTLLARWLAGVEVGLMLALALGGRRQSALRMLAAVGLVYVASEALGMLWPRTRPFARVSTITPLVAHAPSRSFPSRHVAAGLAMARIGRRAHPRLGLAMALVAGLLGASRVAAGLHYPSDVLAGAALGWLVGRGLRQRPT
ncbi:MAG TPA: phosphatase PAP2 family protein [Chloroflexota bacterium]